MRTAINITLDLIVAGFLIEALMRRDAASAVLFGVLFIRGIADTFERCARRPERSADVVSLALVKQMRRDKRTVRNG